MSNDAIMFYQFKDLVEGIAEKHNLACVQVDELYEENKKLRELISRIETYRRIDDGYTDVNTAIDDAIEYIKSSKP